MLGRLLTRRAILEEAGAKARREHSAWLTQALSATGPNWPRIPTRRVSNGGFARMMATPHGPQRARQWWAAAMIRTQGLDPHHGGRIGR